jgi:hypothetical protein
MIDTPRIEWAQRGIDDGSGIAFTREETPASSDKPL